MKKYELISNYKPNGDQPEAIKKLVDGVNKDEKWQVLLGARTWKTCFWILKHYENFFILYEIFSFNKIFQNTSNMVTLIKI